MVVGSVSGCMTAGGGGKKELGSRQLRTLVVGRRHPAACPRPFPELPSADREEHQPQLLLQFASAQPHCLPPSTLCCAPLQLSSADRKEYQSRQASEQASAKRAGSRRGLGSSQAALDHYKLLGLERTVTGDEVRCVWWSATYSSRGSSCS